MGALAEARQSRFHQVPTETLTDEANKQGGEKEDEANKQGGEQEANKGEKGGGTDKAAEKDATTAPTSASVETAFQTKKTALKTKDGAIAKSEKWASDDDITSDKTLG